VERNCYRCGSPIEEKAPFCPGCGAPQIRVTAPEATNPAISATADSLPDPGQAGYAVPHAGPIQWRAYSRAALPLAVLTGFIAAMFFPAVIIAFPLSFRRTLSQYLQFHPGPMPSRQGARLGAFMALLTFGASLIFLCANHRLRT
jgi:hypothetical protein